MSADTQVPAIPESSAIQETPPKDPPVFHLMLVPDVGDMSLRRCLDVNDFSEQLHIWLMAKEKGIFKGLVIPFYGWLIDYTEALQSFRVMVPNLGEIEISESVKGKYTGPESTLPAVST